MKKSLKILLIIILLILVIYVFYHFLLVKLQKQHAFKRELQNTENVPFSISKIMLYSSAYGENKNTTFQQSNWILDVFQYSDIAIFLDNGGHDLTAENTVKKLWIEDITLPQPKIGTPSFYYLASLNFGTANFDEQNKIQEKLEFTVLNDKNTDANLSYTTPTFFTDCSNPITLKYVNHSVKNNFEITSNEPISFNGNLLKMAEISLDDLATTISFSIHIVSNHNEEFFCRLSFPIELENDTNSIFERKCFSGK